MLNDILTGKAATDAAPTDPYRTPGEVPPTLVCTSCQQTFPPSQAMNGLCRACAKAQPDALAQMMHEQGVAARNRNALYDEMERRKRNERIFRFAILIAIAILAGMFKWGMRKQMDEDARQMNGEPSYER